MKETWYGCPDCHLAFSAESEYRWHFEANHPNRKFKIASKISSAAG